MTAEDIMTSDPISIQETTTLSAALELMSEHNIRHIPVLREQAVIGMISEGDLRGLGVSLVRDVETLDNLRGRLSASVSNLMTGNALTVDRDAQLSDVVDILIEEKVGAVCVVEAGTAHLVGIVSYLDVLRAARDLLD